jgi:subfamily B ATP-binding cassette protein MsbA
MSPDNLIAYLIVFSQIIPPAKSITTGWFAIQKGMASIDRVDVILNAEEKIAEKENAIAINGFNESIEFRGVWYAYNNEPVLKDINLKIKRTDSYN